MAELYVFNPHAPSHVNVAARATAWARGERPAWDPATTDGTPKPPVHPFAGDQPHGTQGDHKV